MHAQLVARADESSQLVAALSGLAQEHIEHGRRELAYHAGSIAMQLHPRALDYFRQADSLHKIPPEIVRQLMRLNRAVKSAKEAKEWCDEQRAVEPPRRLVERLRGALGCALVAARAEYGR